MEYMIYNRTKDKMIAERIFFAESFQRRMVGLLGRKKLSCSEGLILVPCSAVHTMFMRFPIDVIFLSRDFTVIRVVENMKPWRFTSLVRGSHQVLELKAGEVSKALTGTGDKLELVKY